MPADALGNTDLSSSSWSTKCIQRCVHVQCRSFNHIWHTWLSYDNSWDKVREMNCSGLSVFHIHDIPHMYVPGTCLFVVLYYTYTQQFGEIFWTWSKSNDRTLPLCMVIFNGPKYMYICLKTMRGSPVLSYTLYRVIVPPRQDIRDCMASMAWIMKPWSWWHLCDVTVWWQTTSWPHSLTRKLQCTYMYYHPSRLLYGFSEGKLHGQQIGTGRAMPRNQKLKRIGLGVEPKQINWHFLLNNTTPNILKCLSQLNHWWL